MATAEERIEQVSKFRRIYDAEDSCDMSVKTLRHATTFYELAGEMTKAKRLRNIVHAIERIAR